MSAFGERVELVVVMAAEMRVTMGELQPLEEVAVPGLDGVDAQITTDSN